MIRKFLAVSLSCFCLIEKTGLVEKEVMDIDETRELFGLPPEPPHNAIDETEPTESDSENKKDKST